MPTVPDSARAPIQERNATPLWPLLLYALTGFSGVLAEQGFEKYIALLVGATAVSSAIVIFAYFLGFALGAWATAAILRRGAIRRPLATYGVLELLVGASCVAFTYGFERLSALLVPFQSVEDSTFEKFVVRFAFGAILILPSAALMGASFPLIAQALAGESDGSGRSWVAAYSSNLAGAFVAALGGAYAILPAIGVRGAMLLCGAIGVAVCVACLLLPEVSSSTAYAETPAESGESENAATESIRLNDRVLLLSAALLSGLVFFALEVLWTHLIATVLGASVYAFASMLALVLLGLLIGSLRAKSQKGPAEPAAFSKLLWWSALLLFAQFRLWDYIQIGFLAQIPNWLRSFYSVEGYKFLLGALLIVPPAAFLGTLYPMLLRHPSLARRGAGYFVGYLNTANSIGCLAGALLGVFFFIPSLGSEWSIKMIAAMLAITAGLFFWQQRPARTVLLKTCIPAILIVAYAMTWHWDRLLLTSGQTTWFGQPEKAYTPVNPSSESAKIGLAFFEENAQGGFTTVVKFEYPTLPSKRMLMSNGKFEGTDDLEAQGFAQLAFAAIPSQFVPNFGRALQIGLGTGQSAHTLERLGFGAVDVAEYAPGIVHASSKWFQNVNGDVLAQPGVRLHLEDGRNFLLLSPRQSFDLVSIEITSVWFAGATNLYSREFYEMAKSRLKHRGVFQQWVQFHHTRPRELAVQIGTLRAVFPYVSLWGAGGQGILVATDRPQELTDVRREYLKGRLDILEGIPAAKRDALHADVFDTRLLSPQAVDRMLAQAAAPVNTDHNRWIEYATPRYNWTGDDGTSNLAWLKSFAEPAVTVSAR